MCSKSLLSQASEEALQCDAQTGKTISDFLSRTPSGFEIGDEVEAWSGFVLEDADSSVLMDYRFEGRLRESWDDRLGEVSSILFGGSEQDGNRSRER